MSLVSWKKEFYKKPADKVSEAAALDHSILKWEGLKSKNLKKHGCTYVGFVKELRCNYAYMDIDSTTCALCCHYFAPGLWPCARCPIARYKIRHNIETSNRDCYCYDEYNKSVGAMCKLLTRVKKWVIKYDI